MRQYLMVKVPAADHVGLNAYLVDLFGDDPGSEECPLNAIVGGADPGVATHAFSNLNVSQADATAIAATIAGTYPNSDSRNRNYTAGSYGWADAALVWNLYAVS